MVNVGLNHAEIFMSLKKIKKQKNSKNSDHKGCVCFAYTNLSMSVLHSLVVFTT